MSKPKLETKPVPVLDENGQTIKDPVPIERKILHRASNLIDSLAFAMSMAREANTIEAYDLINLLDPIIDTLKDLAEAHFPA